MALADLLRNKLGVATYPRINPLVDSVGISPVRILDNNPNRVGYLIVNVGSYPLYVAFSDAVSVTYGIYVAPAGGMVSAVWDEDFDLVGYELWGVAGGGTTKIYVHEVVIRL